MMRRDLVYLPVRASSGWPLLGFVAMHTDRQHNLLGVIPIVKDRRGDQHYVDILPFSTAAPSLPRPWATDPDGRYLFVDPIVDSELAISTDTRERPIGWWRCIEGFCEAASEEYYRDRDRERIERLARLNESARLMLPHVLGDRK